MADDDIIDEYDKDGKFHHYHEEFHEILEPIVSEKSYALLEENVYTFKVHPEASKPEIHDAVEQIFGVKVTSVNTINRKGKARRTRFGLGKRKDVKRAIVTVGGGEALDIFSGRVG